MTHEQMFKSNFTSTFLAVWVANKYESACINGEQESLEHPPVEEAEYLAGAAWSEKITILGGILDTDI